MEYSSILDPSPTPQKEKGTSICYSWWYSFNTLQESKQHPVAAISEDNKTRIETFPKALQIPTDGIDVWEIDMRQLKFENKVGSGSFGDL